MQIHNDDIIRPHVICTYMAGADVRDTVPVVRENPRYSPRAPEQCLDYKYVNNNYGPHKGLLRAGAGGTLVLSGQRSHALSASHQLPAQKSKSVKPCHVINYK